MAQSGVRQSLETFHTKLLMLVIYSVPQIKSTLCGIPYCICWLDRAASVPGTYCLVDCGEFIGVQRWCIQWHWTAVFLCEWNILCARSSCGCCVSVLCLSAELSQCLCIYYLINDPELYLCLSNHVIVIAPAFCLVFTHNQMQTDIV